MISRPLGRDSPEKTLEFDPSNASAMLEKIRGES
jgi:hypothetical protein